MNQEPDRRGHQLPGIGQLSEPQPRATRITSRQADAEPEGQTYTAMPPQSSDIPPVGARRRYATPDQTSDGGGNQVASLEQSAGYQSGAAGTASPQNIIQPSVNRKKVNPPRQNGKHHAVELQIPDQQDTSSPPNHDTSSQTTSTKDLLDEISERDPSTLWMSNDIGSNSGPPSLEPSPSEKRNPTLKAELENMILEEFPGTSKEEAWKRYNFMRLTFQEHHKHTEIAYEEYALSLEKAAGSSPRQLCRARRLHHVYERENAMLHSVQELCDQLWREWHLMEPEGVREFHLFNKLPPELRRYIWFMSVEPRIVEVRPTHEDFITQIRLAYPVSLQPNVPGRHRHHPYGFRRYDPPAASQPPLDERDDCGTKHVYGWPLTRTPYPPQFHACQESRMIVRELYQECSETSFYAAKGSVINYEIDTIYCPQDLDSDCDQCFSSCIYPDTNAIFRLAMNSQAAKKIRSLAVTYGGLGIMCDSTTPPVLYPTTYPRQHLTKFPIPETMKKYTNLREIVFVHCAKNSHETLRNLGPGKVTHWDDELITEINGERMPDIPAEYLELEVKLQAQNRPDSHDDYGFVPEVLFDRMEGLAKGQTFEIERDWYWDKAVFDQRLVEAENESEEGWKRPALRLIKTTRGALGYPRFGKLL